MIRLKVREVAAAKGMGMRKLAKNAEIAYNTLRTIYRDPYRPVTTITLDKLAQALGVDASELIESVSEYDARDRERQMVRLKVREIAESKGYDPSTLAQDAEVDTNTIKHIWQNPYNATATNTLERIARTLQVSIHDLIEELSDEE